MTDFWTQLRKYTNVLDHETPEGDNPEYLLPKLLTHAEHEREVLEAQFDPIFNNARENRSLVSQLQTGISTAKNLLEQRNQLRSEERKLAIEMKAHENKAEVIAQDFRTTVNRLNNTSRMIDYLRCLETLLNHSSSLKKSLSSASLDESLSIYSKIAHLTELIHDTSTEHLRSYSADLTIYWYEQLKSVLDERMEKILTRIEFPYVHKLPASHLIEVFDKHRDQFRQELLYLFKLRLPNHIKHPDVRSRLHFIGWKAIPLFIQMLLKGFIIRFNFHFYGQQKTNDRQKPEWYLNQIVSWILDHDYFFTEQLQPLLNELTDSTTTINAKVEFIRSLIELVIIKLNSQITSILIDTPLFKHYIEEILIFSQRLFEKDIAYPTNLPNCMNLLCDEIVFERWLQVEHDVAHLKVDSIFESPAAHQSVYERMLERNPDEIKISQCAETFLTLIYAMEERYRLVSYPSSRLRLLSLQIDLLEKFLEKLKSSFLTKQQDVDPVSKDFCSRLNSIVYIADAIRQWQNRSPYKELQYLNDEYTIFAKKYGTDYFEETYPVTNRIQIDPVLGSQFDLIQINMPSRKSTTVLIFAPILQEYDDAREGYCKNIVDHTMKILKRKSGRYRNEKWSTMPNPQDYSSQSLTPSAVDLLLELQTVFSHLSVNLLKNIFNEICAQIVLDFDRYLFNCVVNDHKFNAGGAQQFLFDVERGWSRISKDHVSLSFIKCRESALLLTLPVGSPPLSLDALKHNLSLTSSSSSTADESIVSSPLSKMGIDHLSEFEANEILQRRLDLTDN